MVTMRRSAHFGGIDDRQLIATKLATPNRRGWVETPGTRLSGERGAQAGPDGGAQCAGSSPCCTVDRTSRASLDPLVPRMTADQPRLRDFRAMG
jgi:hypothetical protein